jgi:hypothetical protein
MEHGHSLAGWFAPTISAGIELTCGFPARRRRPPACRDEIRGFGQPRSAFPPMWRLRIDTNMKSERREA